MPENHDSQPTQLTQPKGRNKDGELYEPIEIPVPTRGQVMDFFRKVIRPGRVPSSPQPPGPRP